MTETKMKQLREYLILRMHRFHNNVFAEIKQGTWNEHNLDYLFKQKEHK